jgi:membrane protein implicated in regulation of membrane protease activity
MVLFTLGVAIVVGAIISLATGSWWFLVLAVVVHALGTILVVSRIGSRLQEEDKPDPVTEARLAEEPDEAARERERSRLAS